MRGLLVFVVAVFVVVAACGRGGADEVAEATVLLEREGYRVMYSPQMRCARWVEWTLTPERLQGDVKRCIHYDSAGRAIGIADFSPALVEKGVIEDREVPQPRPSLSDWRLRPDSMSRGHMCPAADCKFSEAAMNQSFLLTNICVQTRRLNSGSWNRLEMKCRDHVNKYGDTLTIVCGPVFLPGRPVRRMGSIAVPDAFFKAVVSSRGACTWGFLYVNDDAPHAMDDALTTLDSLRRVTGIDLLPGIADNPAPLSRL